MEFFFLIYLIFGYTRDYTMRYLSVTFRFHTFFQFEKILFFIFVERIN